jgi:PAS domain S-box-containing protein
MPVSPPSLDEQVTQLLHLSNQIREIFARGSYTQPVNLLPQLSEFSDTLVALNREISSLRKDNVKLHSLIETSKLVNSCLDPAELLRILMDTAIELTQAERGFLLLRNSKGNLSVSVARNWQKESISQADLAVSKTIIQRVIASGKPVLTHNAMQDARFGAQDSVMAHTLRSTLCVPVIFKNQLIGIIYTDNRIRSGVFGESERDLLEAFSSQAAIAIENSRLVNTLRSSLAEIREMNDLTSNVMASIASGVITVDQEDCITLANRSAGRILRWEGGSLVGKNLREIIPCDAGELLEKIGFVWKSEQQVIGLEMSLTFPDLGLMTVLVNLSPLRDANHKIQGIAIVLDDISERKRLEDQQRLFERMVAPAVINQINPNQLKLGGKRCQITTLFADLHGFTDLSERLLPEELVSALNLYLSAAANSILAQQGTIDKFQGDGIMAWFNAPIPQPDHTLRAIQAAIEVRKAAAAIHLQVPADLHLSFGTGIHYGDAVLGLVGTEKRLDYTAIGDSINTAKRIQEWARPDQILISAQAYRHVSGRVVARQMDPIQAKGKSQPIEVYEIINLVNSNS